MYVPDKLLKILLEHIPGFALDRHAFEIAWMLWERTNPRRRHRRFDQAISVSHKRLRSLFGEHGFRQANRHPGHRYFFVHSAQNAPRKQDSFTNGYAPVPWMQKALEWSIERPGPIAMVDRQGKAQRIEANAIQSTDFQGQRVRRWRGITVPSLIEVNRASLESSVEVWLRLCNLRSQGLLDDSALNAMGLKATSIPIALQQTQIFIGLASNPRHLGCLPIKYTLHESGRLYGQGLNLQSCKREVRQVALEGLWDADISACHFAIMTQMAKGFGCECDAIDAYVADKKSFRQSIAQDVGMLVSTTKKLINALGYGARESLSPRTAIAAEIGAVRAEVFFKHPLVLALKQDIHGATKAILKGSPRRSNRLINLANRLARDASRSGASQMSHLLQGVEAVALEAAVRHVGGDVVLLQHDGFTAMRRIDPDALRQAVLHDTGYDLRFEVEQIESPMGRLLQLFCTKSVNQEKVNSNKYLDHFWPISLGTLVAWTPEDVPPVNPIPLPPIDSSF